MHREFLVRHIKSSKIKRSYTTGDSRRKNTKEYSLGVEAEMKTVCRQFFFNTFGISEQMAKTALKKMTPTGTLENDKRGGRQSDADIERDQLIWKEISDHIDRFPSRIAAEKAQQGNMLALNLVRSACTIYIICLFKNGCPGRSHQASRHTRWMDAVGKTKILSCLL